MQNAEKISVTITSEMLDSIRESVARGEFASTSEALRDAVRVWQRERREAAVRLGAIRARVNRSLADTAADLDEDAVADRIARLHARTVKAHPRADV